MTAYDSAADTTAHVARVAALLRDVRGNLAARAASHEESKLSPPEKDGFDLIGERQRGITYGSKEYFAQFAGETVQESIRLHYAHNRHHPEHWAMGDDGVVDKDAVADGTAVARMSLLDLIEMVADWRAASERHADGSIAASVAHNTARFGLSPQLSAIVRNTIDEMGW